MIDTIVFYIGLAITIFGGVMDVIAALGFFKFRDFYLRLHAATIGAIGGGFYPLIGVSLMTLGLDLNLQFKLSFTGVCLLSAAIIALGIPSGTHALARATYRSREAEPMVVEDKLREYVEGNEQ